MFRRHDTGIVCGVKNLLTSCVMWKACDSVVFVNMNLLINVPWKACDSVVFNVPGKACDSVVFNVPLKACDSVVFVNMNLIIDVS